jgi:hypothetical protein
MVHTMDTWIDRAFLMAMFIFIKGRAHEPCFLTAQISIVTNLVLLMPHLYNI